MIMVEDLYIIVTNKEDKVIFHTSSQLEAIKTIRMIWAADGDADLFMKVNISEKTDAN